MKPLHALLLFAALAFGFMACGPSEAERKADSMEVDSTKKEMKSAADRMIDSMNEAMNAMSGDTAKKDSAKK